MDLKQLKRLVKFCRVNGITEFKQGDLSFTLTPVLDSQSNRPKQAETHQPGSLVAIPDTTPVNNLPEVPWAKYSDEELATWSAVSEDEVGAN